MSVKMAADKSGEIDSRKVSVFITNILTVESFGRHWKETNSYVLRAVLLAVYLVTFFGYRQHIIEILKKIEDRVLSFLRVPPNSGFYWVDFSVHLIVDMLEESSLFGIYNLGADVAVALEKDTACQREDELFWMPWCEIQRLKCSYCEFNIQKFSPCELFFNLAPFYLMVFGAGVLWGCEKCYESWGGQDDGNAPPPTTTETTEPAETQTPGPSSPAPPPAPDRQQVITKCLPCNQGSRVQIPKPVCGKCSSCPPNSNAGFVNVFGSPNEFGIDLQNPDDHKIAVAVHDQVFSRHPCGDLEEFDELTDEEAEALTEAIQDQMTKLLEEVGKRCCLPCAEALAEDGLIPCPCCGFHH